jgi:uncharacterized protein YndB with AHSA1/START domain
MATTTSSGTAVVTLPGDTQIHVTRDFNAPKDLVYRAFTEPDLIRRWWSSKRGAVTVCDVDLKVGGAWRYVMVTEDGREVAFHGTYREIVPNERLVYTELFEMPGLTEDDATVNTVTLTERDGRTTMTSITECPTAEARTMIIETGMEGGMQDAYDLLEEVAVSLLDAGS